MSDDLSIYPRIETGYAFTTDMNDEIIKKFNEGNFTQGSAILKIKYNPKNLNRSTPPCKRTIKKSRN